MITKQTCLTLAHIHLGEMYQKRPIDSTTFKPAPKMHSVAYAAQESWVQNATIRVRDLLFDQFGL
jgi:hypothetical protein